MGTRGWSGGGDDRPANRGGILREDGNSGVVYMTNFSLG